jgi:hypothetical protein
MEVAQMLSGDIAKHQIQDRIRAAEQDRLSRTARVDRGRRTQTAMVRRVGSGLLAAIVGRRRKATPTAAGVRLA